jgi:repressor LexA
MILSLAIRDASPTDYSDRYIGETPQIRAGAGHLQLRRLFAMIDRAEFEGDQSMATLTKRQKQMVDYLEHYIGEHGYAPTLAEVGEYFGLSSLATVHKHLRNLEQKGFITREHNHSRALEIAASARRRPSHEIELLGQVAAGAPIEAIETRETISVPEEFIRRENTFCLRVKGESMVEDGIRDGDYIIVEGRETADNGETVVALVGNEATVKKFYREGDGRIRLQPANAAMQPIVVAPDDVTIRGVVVGLMRRYR